MEARKILYNKWKALAKSFSAAQQGEFLFIDGRMNAEEFQIFSITGDDDYNMKRYEEEFLFSDAEVAPAVCSYKQTTYCASMIASFIKGFKIKRLFAPTNCIVLIMNLLENIFKRMELLISTTASSKNKTENPKIHFRILLRLL